MADLTITAASVAKVVGNVVTANAGATITAGQPVYVSTTDSLIYPTDADVVTSAVVAGIALNGGAIGQPITYQTSGTITIGATVVTGKAYYASATAGGICPEADLLTGDFATFIGFATSTTVITISIKACGVAKA